MSLVKRRVALLLAGLAAAGAAYVVSSGFASAQTTPPSTDQPPTTEAPAAPAPAPDQDGKPGCDHDRNGDAPDTGGSETSLT